MVTKSTIEKAYEIDAILGKLWTDGDIDSYQRGRIMAVVNRELCSSENLNKYMKPVSKTESKQ